MNKLVQKQWSNSEPYFMMVIDFFIQNLYVCASHEILVGFVDS